MPAVLDRLYTDEAGQDYRGTTTGDGIFNRVLKNGNTWQTDIQDQLDETLFGGDAWTEATGDLLVDLSPAKRQTFTQASIRKDEASWRHDVLSYKGETITVNVSGTVTAVVPVLWMSYSANASAGLKSVKGTPVLIVEGGKPGIFPESLGSYPDDSLSRVLRFRHGGKVSDPALAGAKCVGTQLPVQPQKTGRLRGNRDLDYEPREKMNAGFLDGHVERLGWWQMFTPDPSNPDTQPPTPKVNVWFGSRRSTSF